MGSTQGLEQLHITEDPSALGEGSQIDIQTGCKGIQARSQAEYNLLYPSGVEAGGRTGLTAFTTGI